jgi:Holliday junction resolvasome RuvABC endonuclease subunit
MAVGIDPSLSCTGLAIVDEHGGVWTGRAKTDTVPMVLTDRRRRIRLALSRILAQLPLTADLFVIEEPSQRSQMGNFNDRVGLYWLLVDQLLARGPVAEVNPLTRLVYATGSGASRKTSKAEVKAAMRALPLDAKVPDDNVADGLALALMGARYLGIPADGDLDQKHLRAMGTPSWPTNERA